jgi:hypothetical protein
MSMNDHIDRKVEETLASLDDLRRAEPAPFFHTRLMARMERTDELGMGGLLRIISRPAFVIAATVLFLALNGYILMGFLNGRKESRSEDVTQSLALEYGNGQNTVSYFDNNTENP